MFRILEDMFNVTEYLLISTHLVGHVPDLWASERRIRRWTAERYTLYGSDLHTAKSQATMLIRMDDLYAMVWQQ